MEPLKTSETLMEGLMVSKQDQTTVVNPEKEKFSVVSDPFDFVEESDGIVKGFEPKSQPSISAVENGNKIDSISHGVVVPIKGISLFVELTGGITTDPHGKKSNCEIRENVCGVNDRLTSETHNEISANHQEYEANVGDFVWAIVKNQSWWPGIVCDSKESSKVQKPEDGFLVKCFGNGNYVKCLPHQLRPFVGYFEQFSKLNNSKTFVNALETAVSEFGLRIKTEFACSCFSKTISDQRGNIGNLLVNQFQPATFLDYIKDLARDVSIPTNKIDHTINHNLLNQLKMANFVRDDSTSGILSDVKIEEESWDFNDNNFNLVGEIKTERHYETRERRKSKFLSYPYANANGVTGTPVKEEEQRVEDVNGGVELTKTNSQPAKKSRKKRGRKPKGMQENVCSSEVVLTELQFVAQDCCFPYKSKKFDSVEQFLTRFRRWAFKDSEKETTFDPQILPEVKVQPEKDVPKKVRKKKSGTDLNRGSLIIDFQNSGILSHEVQNVENKKTEVGLDQGLQNIEVKEDVDDKVTILNFGDLPVTKIKNPISKKPKKDTTNDWNSNFNPLQNVNLHMDPFLIHNVEGLNQPNAFHFTNEIGSNPLCFSRNHGEPLMSTVPATVTHEPKKRGRKRKTMMQDLKANTGLTQNNPGLTQNLDLTQNQGLTQNLNSTQNLGLTQNLNLTQNLDLTQNLNLTQNLDLNIEANPGSTETPNLGNENGGEKKKGKKGKRKERGVPCINLSYNKVNQEQEVKGTAFLLKFSSDHPLPSEQDLNAVFSKYGPLNESETQVLNQSQSGQVVFLDSSSAGEAFWGLQNDHPFGESLINYRIQHLSGAESEPTVGFRTPIKNPSGLKPLQKTDNISSNSAVLPDLNGNNTAENELPKKSKKVEEFHLPSYNKVQQGNGEASGTALLLKFSPNHPLPCHQDLNSVFCKYGELNELETRVSSEDFSGQVVFIKPCSAGDAVQNLEKVKPFGESLVSFRVHHLYNVQPAIVCKTPIKKIPLPKPKPAQQREAGPDLAAIKKNLEMMNSMLEKAGNTLSPEMRAKLESEIRGLMNKVSIMDGSSSSSL